MSDILSTKFVFLKFCFGGWGGGVLQPSSSPSLHLGCTPVVTDHIAMFLYSAVS